MRGIWVRLLSFKMNHHMIQIILADRTGERYFHIAVWWWAVIIGFVIALCTMSIAARYLSLFLMAVGYAGMLNLTRKKPSFILIGFAMNLVWVSNTVPRPPA